MSHEPSPELDALARRVIGAAIAVHRTLGPGHKEIIYQRALCVELGRQNIPYVCEHHFAVHYEGVNVGDSRVDLLIDQQLIVEAKAVEQFAPIHTAQTIAYLRGLNLHLGILINFNASLLKDGGIKRILNPNFSRLG